MSGPIERSVVHPAFRNGELRVTQGRDEGIEGKQRISCEPQRNDRWRDISAAIFSIVPYTTFGDSCMRLPMVAKLGRTIRRRGS